MSVEFKLPKLNDSVSRLDDLFSRAFSYNDMALQDWVAIKFAIKNHISAPEPSGPDKGLPSLPDYVRYIDELVDKHGVELDVLAWDGVKRLLPATPTEPSGLWAMWAAINFDADTPSFVHRVWPGHDGVQLPAPMTAAEIARLCVGDCRMMKEE